MRSSSWQHTRHIRGKWLKAATRSISTQCLARIVSSSRAGRISSGARTTQTGVHGTRLARGFSSGRQSAKRLQGSGATGPAGCLCCSCFSQPVISPTAGSLREATHRRAREVEASTTRRANRRRGRGIAAPVSPRDPDPMQGEARPACPLFASTSRRTAATSSSSSGNVALGRRSRYKTRRPWGK